MEPYVICDFIFVKKNTPCMYGCIYLYIFIDIKKKSGKIPTPNC